MKKAASGFPLKVAHVLEAQGKVIDVFPSDTIVARMLGQTP